MEGPALHSAAKNKFSAHLLVRSPLALSMSFWVHCIMVAAIVQPMGTLTTPQEDLHRSADRLVKESPGHWVLPTALS